MATRAMGIGTVGGPDITFKRSFRYTFIVDIPPCYDSAEGPHLTQIPESFVKVASRPSLTTEETEINFLNAKTWIPGKSAWETMTVTYLDVAHYTSKPLWDWLVTTYNFADPVNLQQGNRQSAEAVGTLTMYDGCGAVVEVWKMRHLWPTAVNFGEVDYSSSEISTIELTMRYSDVEYVSVCPQFQPTSCCQPCGTR